MMTLNTQQLLGLFVLAIPIACIARTVVYEEVFREIREFCQHRSRTCQTTIKRKFYYLFTCEYCFSHYVTLGVLVVTRYKLMYDDWRGYLVAFFSLVLVANFYMALYARLRVDITSEKTAIDRTQREKQLTEMEIAQKKHELEEDGVRIPSDGRAAK